MNENEVKQTEETQEEKKPEVKKVRVKKDKPEETQDKPSENEEKEYMQLYSEITNLIKIKNINPTIFKEQAKLDELIKKAEEYKFGAYGTKDRTLGISGYKFYISENVKLPQTYVDIIVNHSHVKEDQYLKL